jgi:6-phosphogluconate dehydrogenase
MGHISNSGEWRWTIAAALDEAVPASLIRAALFGRFESRGNVDFGH